MDTRVFRTDLNKIDGLKKFVQATTVYDEKVVVVSNAGYVVDGKSLMGLFSLNLDKGVYVFVDFVNNTKVDAFLKDLSDSGIVMEEVDESHEVVKRNIDYVKNIFEQ